jgi:hypothetical protein
LRTLPTLAEGFSGKMGDFLDAGNLAVRRIRSGRIRAQAASLAFAVARSGQGTRVTLLPNCLKYAISTDLAKTRLFASSVRRFALELLNDCPSNLRRLRRERNGFRHLL